MAIKDFVLTFFYNKYIMIMEAQNEVFNKILSGRLLLLAPVLSPSFLSTMYSTLSELCKRANMLSNK